LGPESNYAVKRIMHLSDMQLSGVHCTISLFPVQINTTPAYLAVETVIKLIWRSRCYNVIIIPSKS